MTTALPKIMICGHIEWTHDDIPKLFDGVAQIIVDDAPNRAEFHSRFHPGGPYEATVGIYRNFLSAHRLGIFDRELVAGLPHSVQWIAFSQAGYNEIDVCACKEKGERATTVYLIGIGGVAPPIESSFRPGIRVSNTPGAVDEATATTALYLILSALRHFSKAERSLRAGTWKQFVRSSETRDLSTRTVGILGLGGIGLALAHLVHGFPGEMRVLYHNRRPRTDVPEWCEYVDSIQALCARSDVLSVLLPLNQETEGIVGERAIRAMKRGSVIVNAARGKVLDQEAVIRALDDGHLASVGLDVFPDEPNVDPRLLEFPQVALLPHMGTDSQDTEKKMELRALENLKDFLMTGSGKDLVPELR